MLTNPDYKYIYTKLVFFIIILLSTMPLHAANITFTWDPPATNTGGSPLTDLAGYKMYYGTESGNYTQSLDMDNVSEYQVNNLTDGLTYYFVTTAYNSSAIESGYSSEFSVTIEPPAVPAPEITITDSVSPDTDLQIPFGNKTEGSSSDRTLTITNVGNAGLEIYNIAQQDPIASPFSIVNENCSGQTIMPSTICTFTIRFSPATGGSFSNSFDIPSNDSDENPVIVSVSGTGLANIPPSAHPGGPYSGFEGQSITLDGSGSGDSDGSIDLYEWDINNDGEYDYNSTSATRNHTYAQQGTYTIKLRVTDNHGATDSTTTTAYISDTSNNPPSAHPGGPYSGFEGQSITLDGSGSGDSNGSIDLYEWDINNDGEYDYNSTSATRNHTYAQQGTYTIKLRVTDNHGATDSTTTTAYISDSTPVAGFTGSPTDGIVPLQVSFANNSIGYDQPLSYEWDFDNNGTTDSTDQNPSYSYTDEGTYSVKLSITDSDGSTNIITRVNYIDVTTANSPPSAHSGGPYSGIEGQSITLDGSGSGDSGGSIALYEWDINNDGEYDYNSTSATRNHTYAQQGTYTIKLRVTDNHGATDSTTTTAYISDSTPVAGFTGSPRNGIAPLQVKFVNSATGHDDPLTYEWDFDNDGTTDSTAQNPSYSYTDEGTYTVKLTVTDSDGSTKTRTRMNYINVTPSTSGENILGCYDGGNIECLERSDGGNESNNLVAGKPRLDNMDFNFKITVGDASGNAPQYIKLYMTQRNNPSSGDFYGYDMSCSGDFGTGATCSYVTKLGPAAAHTFFFEAMMSDGSTLRYPYTGYITGPEIQLLAGYNLVGLPRDIIYESLDGISAFGSTSSYRWDADLEYYTKVTITDPVNTGEGYYVKKESDTLPEHDGYGDLPDAEFTYQLKPGWNIVTNPYTGNVSLTDIKVGKGSNTPIAWTESTSNLWMTNAIYCNDGRDWGGTYSFETDSEATLVPWIGYWIYLNMEDDTYYIEIPQP